MLNPFLLRYHISVFTSTGQFPDRLARSILLLAKRFSKKSCFAGYTYRDEIESEMILHMTKGVSKFNTERSQNPFAYLSQIALNAARQMLKAEKKHQRIRDQELTFLGCNGSFAFQEEHGYDQFWVEGSPEFGDRPSD